MIVTKHYLKMKLRETDNALSVQRSTASNTTAYLMGQKAVYTDLLSLNPFTTYILKK